MFERQPETSATERLAGGTSRRGFLSKVSKLMLLVVGGSAVRAALDPEESEELDEESEESDDDFDSPEEPSPLPPLEPPPLRLP